MLYIHPLLHHIFEKNNDHEPHIGLYIVYQDIFPHILIYYIPNTFTPDGDSYNENLAPVFTSGYDPYDFDLFIFNRWGETVWESHDSSVGWDGTYGASGKVVQNGSYNWRIEFKTTETYERILGTGHVNVLK